MTESNRLTNRCREEFEKWAMEALHMKPTWFHRDENGDYNNPINMEWAAWKAAWDCRCEYRDNDAKP